MMTLEQHFVNRVMAVGNSLVNKDDTLRLNEIYKQHGKRGIVFIIDDPLADINDVSMFRKFDDYMEDAKSELFDDLDRRAGFRLDWESFDDVVRIMVYFPKLCASDSTIEEISGKIVALNARLQEKFSLVCA